MKRAVLIGAVAALFIAGSAMAEEDRGGLIGSGTRTENCGQMLGSGGAAPCQTMGSGGFTSSTQDQWMGNGARADDGGQTVGSGGGATIQDGGYLGSGLAVREFRLLDGSSLLVVSSDHGTLVIPIE